MIQERDDSAIQAMTYAQASSELEQVIRALESNQLELEQNLTLYAYGVRLLASLRSRLTDAEQKVTSLMGQIEVDTDDRDVTLS